MALFVILAQVACGGGSQLPPASGFNVEARVRIFAVTGTPIHLPSGWAILFADAIRFDQSAGFDFAFDIDPSGQPVFKPLGAFGLLQPSGNAGLQHTQLTWDEIKLAEINGYIVDRPVPIAVGDRLFARSTVTAFCFNGSPTYAKIEVLDIEMDVRAVTFNILSNPNCGLRGLEPGLPSR